MTRSNTKDWKTFGHAMASGVFLVEGSRVYEIDAVFKDDLDAGLSQAIRAITPYLKADAPPDLGVPVPPAPQNISLNVSSSCNLACTYCYAGRGAFEGAQTRHMKWPVAKAAIDKLVSCAEKMAPITIGFIGGEPFVNRRLIHKVTEYGSQIANSHGLDIRFSVTTNGELLIDADLEMLRSHRFAVTFSIDGDPDLHESQRKGASFHRMAKNARALIANAGTAQIAARATVMCSEMRLQSRFDAIRDIGFEDIGFSPVRMGAPGEAFEEHDWPRYLDEMITLAEREMSELLRGKNTAFTNLAIALKKIRGGACSPYPCGAGGGYFSVAATGEWYACHRAIGDSRFHMGDNSGLDASRRQKFLKERHVGAQTECSACWARYLCSGACHQEASAKSDESCAFIRGWLEYCLHAYSRLERQQAFKREIVS